ncbi:MAG: SRPBCC family protein [Sphingomonas sp.]|uniref:SRPBCC family protein n=1 Tax=Sphingomonas sp. TaxID=28214 RepID=UPI002272B27F|nr:SRPBCC family protein [Sphingomonas sp.]MCX8476708.1 SRPBCC family protein [Sphingomonas sp.]
MASLHHEVFIAADPGTVWGAAREVDRLHDRLVPGFVAATEMLDVEGAPVRRVTFVNGAVADETIVSVDDARRRLVWAIKAFEHHNGALQVLEAPEGARVVWTADLLPDSLADRVSPMMAQGLACMKAHLESGAGRG